MWGYYVALALRSSGRSKALTALVIVLLAFGVAACMVSYAVFRATTSDPLPAKSSRLYWPLIDNVGATYNDQGQPHWSLSYIDAVALWHAHKASQLTLLYDATWQVESDNPLVPAMSQDGDAVTADFFSMFDVPFRFGGGWTADDDAQHATVAVINEFGLHYPNQKAAVNAANKKQWEDWSKDSVKLSQDLVAESAKGKTADVAKLKTMLNALNTKCNDCHEKFRDDP